MSRKRIKSISFTHLYLYIWYLNLEIGKRKCTASNSIDRYNIFLLSGAEGKQKSSRMQRISARHFTFL